MEVYYNPPYTNGGIEKSTANLIGYEKTNELKPGESQTVTISFTAEDMASYDYLEMDATCWKQEIMRSVSTAILIM